MFFAKLAYYHSVRQLSETKHNTNLKEQGTLAQQTQLFVETINALALIST